MSDDADPDHVTSVLGLRPDRLVRKGEKPSPKAKESKFSSWRKTVLSEHVDGRPEDAAATLLAWGPAVARRIGELVDTSIWEASLVVVQQIDDLEDSRQLGIWLNSEMIIWMAQAKLGLDIDQYVIVD
ncbi:DUF4279 domain-containing protein [Nonomuraea dietziae]|uniref:DUF4279 domain-containing protein n=1 Tax=Nonomuraea dietziae TaxID=65515 RepID=UPI0033F51C4D